MKLSKVDSKRIIALLERIAYQTSVHSNRLEFEQYLQGVVYGVNKRELKRRGRGNLKRPADGAQTIQDEHYTVDKEHDTSTSAGQFPAWMGIT